MTAHSICGEVLADDRVCIQTFGTEHSHSDPGATRPLGADEPTYCADPRHDAPCWWTCSVCQSECDGTRFVAGVVDAWFPKTTADAR